MKTKGLRIKAVAALCVLLLSVTLSSCTLMSKAELTTDMTENSAVIPSVSGFLNSSSINRKLESEFSPAAEQMKLITDDSDGRLHVEYKMTEQNGGV